MMRVILVLALALGVALGQTRPMISETYRADLNVEIRNDTHSFDGKGFEVRDQPKGTSVSEWVFDDEHRVENIYILERFDIGAVYTVERGHECMKTKLASNETMPLQWAWLKLANHTGKIRDGDVWEADIGYAKVGVLVSEQDPNIPIASWRIGEQRSVHIEYMNFDPKFQSRPAFFDVPSGCKNATSRNIVGNTQVCLAGATMIAKAKVWVDNHVPYNQGATYDGYREDCSGYVSMAWELSKPGLVTSTLPSVSKMITKADLKEGDVLLDTAEHVVLFAGWANAAKTEYISYEETRPGEGTVTRSTPYPYWYNTAAFKPYRYNNIC